MFDFVFKNGQIIDGSGNPWFKSDVAVKRGKIEKIGYVPSSEGDFVVDASRLVVCPGFIDMHAHSDLYLLINPKAESKIRQGVTTEVVGNCGSSMAPIVSDKIEIFKKKAGAIAEEVEWDWRSFEDYQKKIEVQGISLNIAPLVGHGTVRTNVMGIENRAPTTDELDEMSSQVSDAMEAGAFGMSTGLIYTPGSYAKTEEIIHMAKVVAIHGGIYTSHIRNEDAWLLKAVREAIDIGKRAEVPVEISHLKSAGEENWGRAKDALKLMEEAREKGVEITCDFYPYTAGSTGLRACLPPWTHEGGIGEMLRRLSKPTIRERVRSDIEKGVLEWGGNFIKTVGCKNIVISSCAKNSQYEGVSLVEVAETRGIDPYDAAFDLLIEEEGNVGIILHMMSEDDLRTVMKHPIAMVGTDGLSYAPYGALAIGKPHPRNYGTFPRILGRYVRDQGIITLQEAVRKMTSMPAQKLGLQDRGLLREKCRADVVIFDPATILDKATFEKPHQYPQGVEYVIVNGEIVIKNGEHTGKLPGEILRKKAKKT